MSDLGAILDYYDLGEKAFNAKDYLNAAKYFRECYHAYEFGELPVYNYEVESKGGEAYDRYNDIKEKYLSEDQLKELRRINKKDNIENDDIDVNSDNFLSKYTNWSENREDL